MLSRMKARSRTAGLSWLNSTCLNRSMTGISSVVLASRLTYSAPCLISTLRCARFVYVWLNGGVGMDGHGRRFDRMTWNWCVWKLCVLCTVSWANGHVLNILIGQIWTVRFRLSTCRICHANVSLVFWNWKLLTDIIVLPTHSLHVPRQGRISLAKLT